MDPELEKVRQKKMEEMIKRAKYPETVTELSAEQFHTFAKEYKITVVDCWAPWCMPCQMIAPAVEELAKKYQGQVAFGKLNVDHNQTIALKYGVQGIPTLLLFKSGELVDRIVGVVPMSAIEEKIKAQLGEQ